MAINETKFLKLPDYLAGYVSSVAVQDRAVPVGHLTGVVKNDHLGRKVLDTRCWFVLGIRSHVASLDILDRDILDVEANIVARSGLGE